ncbi:MAG: site-2 protease family protein [Candidatus Heimdallarchaeota archaeon]
MDASQWLLIILLIWLLIYLIKQVFHPEDSKSFVIGPGFLLYKSVKLKGFIHHLSQKVNRLWRFLTNVALLVSIGSVFLAIGLFLINAFRLVTQPRIAVGIAPVIPGITIPIDLFLIGFLPIAVIAIFIHEFSHGIVAIIEKISIKSAGFAIFLFFLGGFVEPDEQDLAAAHPRSRMKVYAAGSFANLFFAIFLLILLLPLPFYLILSPAYEPQDGVLILGLRKDGPAELAGLQVGDVITAINGVPVENEKEFSKEYSDLYYRNRVNSIVNTTVILKIQNHGILEIESDNYGIIGIGYMTHYAPRGWVSQLGFSPYGPYRARQFLFLTQILNFIIAFINLLPIPFLDGSKLMQAFFDGTIGEGKGKKWLWFLGILSLFLLLFNMAFTFLNADLLL